MTNPLEKEIERKVCEFAKKNDTLAYKFNSEAHRSVPDRLFITKHGRVFFIEFKREGKKPTEGQIREIQRIKDQGVPVFVVDNVDEGKRIVGLFAVGIDARGYCENKK